MRDGTGEPVYAFAPQATGDDSEARRDPHAVLAVSLDPQALDVMPVHGYVDLLVMVQFELAFVTIAGSRN